MTDPQPQFRWGWNPRPSLARTLPDLQRGTALDLGAGCGGNTLLLAEHGFRVVAVDKNPEAIECLRDRLRGFQFADRVEVVQSTIESFALARRAYDLVLAMNVLHFFPEDVSTRLIRDFQHAVKPGGCVFLHLFGTQDRATGTKFHADPPELRRLFETWTVLRCTEGFIRDDYPPLGPHTHHVVEFVARKEPLRDGGASALPTPSRESR